MRRERKEEGIRLGRIIRDAREGQGWTQDYVAKQARVHPMYLSQVERGYYLPSNDVLLRLESFLHLSPGILAESPKEIPIYHIGDLIRRLRLQKEWTQEQLAAKAGVTDGAISFHETGMSLPDLGTLERLAKVFGVDIELFRPFMMANIPGERSMWTHIVADGVLQGERVRLIQPPPRVYKPFLEDYPDPVWAEFEHLPAQWFPRERLQEVS